MNSAFLSTYLCNFSQRWFLLCSPEVLHRVRGGPEYLMSGCHGQQHCKVLSCLFAAFLMKWP